MRFSQTVVALAVAGLASAQLPDIPSCSANCFLDALTGDGCSSLTDFACHCQKPQLVETVTPCVKKACDVADQSSVSSIVISQCSAAGHPISIPPVEGASPTHQSRSEVTSAVSSSSVPATAPGASSSGIASSTAISPSSSSLAPSSSSASPSSPVFTGAASNMKGNFAGAVAAAAVVAYAV